MLARASAVDVLNEKGEFDIADVRRRGLGYLVSAIKTRTVTYPNSTVAVTREFKMENRKGFLELMGTHHDLWNPVIKDPDAVLASILGYARGALPAKLDEPDAIDLESTELPADVALDTNREHDLEKRTESEAGELDDELNANQQLTDGRRLERQVSATYEPTPQEFPVSNPLTPSKVEFDEKAAVGNTLKGYRKLNGEKAVTRKDNSVEAPQNYAPVSGSRTLL